MSRLKSFTINDFKSIIEEVNKFNTHPDDGHNNPADYPVLNRYNNLKLSMDSHIEYVEEKASDGTGTESAEYIYE